MKVLNLNLRRCDLFFPLLILGVGCSSDTAGDNTGTAATAGSGGTVTTAGTSSGGSSSAAGGSMGGLSGGTAGMVGGAAQGGSAGATQAGSAGTTQAGASAGGSAGTAQGGSAGAAQGGTAGTAQGGDGGMAGGGAGGQSAGGDTWANYAMGFFDTYCVSCHNADNAGDAERDYTMLAAVQGEIEAIGCGVTKSQDDWEARGCSGFPPATQFPVGNGAMPEDAERDRLLAWIDAGMPE